MADHPADVGHDTAEEMTADHSDRFSRGMGLRRLIHGQEHVDDAWLAAKGDEQRRTLETLITESVWGTLWSRNGLPSNVRSLVTIGLLIATRQEKDLRLHIRSALLRNQCTMAEVREVVLQTAAYCGIAVAAQTYELTVEVERDLRELGPGPYGGQRKRATKAKRASKGKRAAPAAKEDA